MMDTQVHFRDPGLTHKADLATETRAAVLGGITSVCEMPNTKPATTNKQAIEEKLARAKQTSHCNYAFYVGATPDNISQLPSLERMAGVCGIKIFMGSSTGSLLVWDDQTLAKVLASGNRRVAVHCEDEQRLIARQNLATDSAHQHPIWRDETTALLATQRLIKLARMAGRYVHILHVTTKQEADFLRTCKDVATMEVLPQHLYLSAPDCYDKLGSLAQMNPPIRTADHQAALWQAIEEGVVDVIASDHAPHTLAEKELAYPNSPSGMTGVQTILPLMLNAVNEGKLTLERLVDLMSANPARVLGMAGKGRIAVGYDADLTIVDMKQNWQIKTADMAYKCGWTPFDNMKIQGKPTHTVINGVIIMERDNIITTARSSKPIRFVGCDG
jgi:dihydroorotase